MGTARFTYIAPRRSAERAVAPSHSAYCSRRNAVILAAVVAKR